MPRRERWRWELLHVPLGARGGNAVLALEFPWQQISRSSSRAAFEDARQQSVTGRGLEGKKKKKKKIIQADMDPKVSNLQKGQRRWKPGQKAKPLSTKKYKLFYMLYLNQRTIQKSSSKRVKE